MAGIIDTIKLAGVLVLAIPAALAGLEFLLVRGEPVIGGALIGLSIGLVALKRFLTLPTDVPSLVAKRVVGSVAPETESSESEE
ncbi:hypothetical protein OB905_10545 [Halobacteria archaeon AArc-dxtr1]|nr:hypothetical protein [Halobacteria archaeon AArc-dxtr1]